ASISSRTRACRCRRWRSPARRAASPTSTRPKCRPPRRARTSTAPGPSGGPRHSSATKSGTDHVSPMDLCALSATALLEGYRRRTLSPVEVTEAVLGRIAALNPKLNAFNLVSEQAIEEARASEARWSSGQPKGLLDGVPVSIKDLILTKDWPTLRGSKTIDPKGPWNDDAPVTARLREHGA